jgi:hypothetical protein
VKKYILNYKGGSKGDFLCNFINGFDITLIDSFNRSQCLAPQFKSLGIFDTALPDEIPNYMIFPTHNAHLIPDHYLRKHNLTVIELLIIDHINTVKIESHFKNFPRIMDPDFKIKYIKQKNIDPSLRKEFFQNAIYRIDLQLITEEIALTDANRCKKLDGLLEDSKFEDVVRCGELCLSYEDIFVNKDFRGLAALFPIDHLRLSSEIDKTWLPDKIEIFGKTYRPRDYGYRNEILARHTA